MDVLIIDFGANFDGESTMTDYVGKVEVLSFSHGVAQQITGDQSNQKRTSGKPNHQDFTITKYLDKASVPLIAACNAATPLPTVTFTVGQNESGKVNAYYVIVLTNVLISSLSQGGGGGGKPQETVTLNYTAISWTYKVQTAAVGDNGNVPTTWNLATNAPS